MSDIQIAILPGDGIGPEITQEAVLLLQEMGHKYGHSFTFKYGQIGGQAVDEQQNPLPDQTIELCQQSDAILLGAVGGPKWDNVPREMKPESGLLKIRKTLGLFANLRPITVFPQMLQASALKPEVIEGVDCLILRELTGGLYFGRPQERFEGEEGLEVVDTLRYKKYEIERIIRKAFEMARLRDNRVTSVDKANVLESGRLWRETAEEVAQDFNDVQLNHMLVDNAAMQLVRDPRQFDVMVTENMFGDILSDEASMITGSLGMLPSASLSADGPGLFEPIHGSAPDIAGQGIANPIATLLSVGMMFKYAFNMLEEATMINQAIERVLDKGYRTADIAEQGQDVLSTKQMGEKIRSEVSAG